MVQLVFDACSDISTPPETWVGIVTVSGLRGRYIVTSLGSADLLVVGLSQDGFVPAPSFAITANYNLTGDSLHGSSRSVQCTSGHEPIAGSEPEEQRCYYGAWEQQTLVCDWIRCGADDSNPARSNTLPVGEAPWSGAECAGALRFDNPRVTVLV